MSDIIQDAADWLTDQMQSHVAVSITYVRGGTSATFDATPGKTAYSAESEVGFVVEFEQRDFIFPVAELTAEGIALPPVRTDRITQTINGASKTYKPFAPNGDRCFKFTDPGEKQIRIYTELVE